ncbi:NUDIX hydrolase [uncultured Cohaesibacter sp.]|uniref:NUDIX hydrolase n=1 Tax=uncultured Cohaesibacter sp. TaxID=1002546 RepID=UPI002AA7BB42|nr:NUDIX hydrolase [uncultured Cohaesibacter sp.]
MMPIKFHKLSILKGEAVKFSIALLAGHVVSTLLLVATGAWFGNEPGWEPVVVFIGLLVPFAVSGYKFVKSVKNEDPASQQMGEIEFSKKCADTLLAVPGYHQPSIEICQITRNYLNSETINATALIFLLRAFGLVRITESNYVKAISEKSDALIKSIGNSLTQRTQVLGDWTAEGISNPESDKLLKIVTTFEEFRVKKQGSKALPARTIEAAIILIKSKYNGTDVFLMQKSSAWDNEGYFWFIGGIRENSDNSLEDCAYRELSEELSIERSMVLSINQLSTASDQRISKRVGCLTKYFYTLFYISLDPDDNRVKDLHSKEFVHSRTVRWTSSQQENMWLTWEEINSSKELKRDAKTIIDCINSSGIDKIPYSCGLSVS